MPLFKSLCALFFQARQVLQISLPGDAEVVPGDTLRLRQNSRLKAFHTEEGGEEFEPTGKQPDLS